MPTIVQPDNLVQVKIRERYREHCDAAAVKAFDDTVAQKNSDASIAAFKSALELLSKTRDALIAAAASPIPPKP